MKKTINSLKKKFSKVKLNGANLETTTKTSFDSLVKIAERSDEWTSSPEKEKMLEQLTKYYMDLLNTDCTDVIPIRVKTEPSTTSIGDEYVEIDSGTLYHRAYVSDVETMRVFSELGIVASEWFGYLESEGEGRLCSFFGEYLDDVKLEEVRKYCQEQKFNYKKGSFKPTLLDGNVNKIYFYIDTNCELMKKISKYDFFEYQKIKRECPEKLNETFPEDILKIFEELIAPVSVASKSFKKAPWLKDYYWKAFPAGVPPQVINGICIHSENKGLMDHLDEISEMFPNATIFDENNTVLRRAFVETKNDGVGV